MFISLLYILTILEKYKYLVIFPITIVEGPIIIIISGFLTFLGVLKVYIIFPILVIGDLIGDCAYYALGRYGHKFKKVKIIGSFLGYKEQSAEKLKSHFKKHTVKTLLIGKVCHGIGAAFQVAAGIAEVNFWEYFLIETIGTIPKTLLLFVIGMYLGDSYLKIDTYLDIMASVLIGAVVLILIYMMLNKYGQKLLKQDEED